MLSSRKWPLIYFHSQKLENDAFILHDEIQDFVGHAIKRGVGQLGRILNSCLIPAVELSWMGVGGRGRIGVASQPLPPRVESWQGTSGSAPPPSDTALALLASIDNIGDNHIISLNSSQKKLPR